MEGAQAVLDPGLRPPAFRARVMSAPSLYRETEEEGNMKTAHEGQGRGFLSDSLFYHRRNCRGVPICYFPRPMMIKLYWFLWIVLIAGAAVLIACVAMDDFAGLSK
jgi:hypothetical protein